MLSAVALIAVLSFGSGIVAERYVFSGTWLGTERLRGGLETDGNPEVDVAFPRQAEVREILEDEYFFLPASPEARATFWADVEKGALDGMTIAAATPVASLDDYRRELDYGAARGMTESLADDYTVFLEPLRGAPLREELAGEYQGIGIWVEHPEGQFTIVAPIPGSPAARADLRAGDVIVAADGQELGALETDAAMSLIRGPVGSSVVLTIRRPGTPEVFDVTVNREEIEIPAVVYEAQAEGKVAHITVAIFGDNTTRELDAALKRAKEEGVGGIVLDLRGNGGGWVTSAQEMIGRFIPEDTGPALYQDLDLKDDGDLISEQIVGGGESAFDVPLAVLIDGGTASAAEIVAGAVRDYERGTLVGEPSFGKGLVQRVHDFEDGSSARITFARWLTPDRIPIPDEGLTPDIVVINDPAVAVDRQLERAVGVVLGTPSAANAAD
ncbi:MAG TPA: S41 family peptidase [Thermomicrobiales bacterium]|nr:S41 family peptidase [Thermomicrobiales bacterium]